MTVLDTILIFGYLSTALGLVLDFVFFDNKIVINFVLTFFVSLSLVSIILMSRFKTLAKKDLNFESLLDINRNEYQEFMRNVNFSKMMNYIKYLIAIAFLGLVILMYIL